jgi:PAS domain S-box-containing protein
LSRKFSLTLKGLIVIGSMVISESIFFVGLNHLLGQSELELQREKTSRESLQEIKKAGNSIYESSKSVQKFALTRDPKYKSEYIATVKTGLRSLKKLKTKITDLRSKQQIAVVEKQSIEMDQRIINMVSALENEPEVPFNEIIDRTIESNQKHMDALLASFQKLMVLQQKQVDESSHSQEKFRETVKTVLFAGLLANWIFGICSAAFLFKQITSRLSLMVDNTKRLREGEKLNPRLSGKDEISELDDMFHVMASALKESAEREREKEALVREIMAQMPVGIVVANSNSEIEFANSHMSESLGFRTEDIQGKTIEDVFSYTPEMLLKVQELTALSPRNQELILELSLRAFSMEEGQKLLMTALDVTERAQLQKLKQAFVAMVSHDLRTPLSSVRGYLELVVMEVLSAEVTKQRAALALTNVDRLIRLVNDLLDIEKLESGGLEFSTEPTAAERIVTLSVDSVSDYADKSSIEIAVLETNHSILICADQDRLAQVLVNLLSNAIKFSPASATVEVSYKRIDQFVVFSVSDHGRGIPTEACSTIFERFKQVEISDGERGKGTGLGLAISKAIVEKHGGRIWVESELSKGSTFFFTIPVYEQ